MVQSSTVIETVVNTVAEEENTSPEKLPPLEDNIDPVTFSQLTANKGPPEEPLEFTYLWYRVTVYPNGAVAVLA